MGEVLFEFIRQGNFVKVSAIDVETRVEAVIVSPASLSQNQMKEQALKKLRYLILKKDI